MAHQRKLIRHAIVALLTNATAAGARVQGSRLELNRKTELPAISVYTLREPVEPDSAETAPREVTRELKVEIAIWVALNGAALDPLDPVDDMTEQVEAVMDADRFVGGNVADSVLEDTEIKVLDEERGDPLVACATLTYAVTYRTTPGVTATDDFLRANTTTQVGDAGDDNTASDLTNVRP